MIKFKYSNSQIIFFKASNKIIFMTLFKYVSNAVSIHVKGCPRKIGYVSSWAFITENGALE